jgi:serine/threonine protein kinase
LWCFLEHNGVDISFWPTRFNICLGIAHGLFYLHEIAQPRIIHRDIKASNILLDKRLQPKIADFGLALLFPDDKTHISTLHVAGTRYCIDSTFFLNWILFLNKWWLQKYIHVPSLIIFIQIFIYDWIYSINSQNIGINYANYSDIIAFKIHWTIYALSLDVLICAGDI